MLYVVISLHSVLSAVGTELCECVQIRIGVYIPNCNYQVKLHSAPWFSHASAAAMTHMNHPFC